VFKANKIKKFKFNHRQAFDAITVAAIVFGLLALVALIYYQARPIKLADIKVPVATDKASYYPSQQIGGIFFGETFFKGNVKILREVYCTNYKGIIDPPKNAADGNFFDTSTKPRKLEGNTIPIGTLPKDVPIGSNCVIQFTNVYNIQTPFGVRHEEYQYYTQNFAIVTKERREQLDCEASGKSSKDCMDATEVTPDGNAITSTDNEFGGGVQSVGGGDDNSQTTNQHNHKQHDKQQCRAAIQQ
jgi:hypothetical protein